MSIVNIGKWLWAVVKYPINFDKHLKLLEEVNTKLESPNRYNQELQFYKETYTLRIEEAKKEANKLAVSDSQKKAQLDESIKRLEQANGEIKKLIESNNQIIEQRDTFQQAFRASEKFRKQLSEELESQKLRPLPTLGDLASGKFGLGVYSAAGNILRATGAVYPHTSGLQQICSKCGQPYDFPITADPADNTGLCYSCKKNIGKC